MANSEEKVPRVFISYSHDSPAHKRWVAKLATKLREKGVDVILDQWELGLGDDVPKFMEKGVYEADRVLMICTEPYVVKADEGKGGVGYEAMIVTGELIQDLGTSKFIPVVRQTSESLSRPRSVSTRLYVNLSEGQDEEVQFELLLRELHQVPPEGKPSLGKNPYAQTPSGQVIPPAVGTLVTPDLFLEMGQSPQDFYLTALNTAKNGDLVLWRRLIRKAKQPITQHLAAWRSKYETQRPGTKEEIATFVLEGLKGYEPLMAVAIAGVESGREEFTSQFGILEDLFHPPQWIRAGPTRIVDFPETVAYVYQALYGSICCYTGQISLAIRFIRNKIQTPRRDRSFPLYHMTEILAYPRSFESNSRAAWEFLVVLPDKWSWLKEPFGETEGFNVALIAYYMALSIHELADTIASGNKDIITGGRFDFEIPLDFIDMSDPIAQKAYRVLKQDSEQVRSIWKGLGLEDSAVEKLWGQWLDHARRCFERSRMLPLPYLLPLEGLFQDLRK